MFEGNLALRGVFESAQSSIAIADPYVGPRLFNLLTARHAGVMIRILSNKISPADLQTAQDFNAEYGHLQLRLQKTGMHDRFVITTLLRPDDRRTSVEPPHLRHRAMPIRPAMRMRSETSVLLVKLLSVNAK
jgi:hypothetical protein